MNGYKKKIVAIVVACVVVAAAVGVPIAFGDDAPAEAKVKGIPPVVESILEGVNSSVSKKGQ